MYEELIKKLRNDAKAFTGFVNEDLLKAADAIEELQKQRDEWESHAALAESFAQGWIPVTERLPEEYTWVLVTAKKHEVAFDAFYDGTQWKDAVLNSLIVTHWMPLPEPKKDGE